MEIYSVTNSLIKSFASYAERPAIVINDEVFSYQDIYAKIEKLTTCIKQHVRSPKRIGILGDKTLYTYIAILSCVFEGITFVPLNKKFPTERTVDMINAAELDAVIVDNNSVHLLSGLAHSLIKNTVFILPNSEWNFSEEKMKIISKSQYETCVPTLFDPPKIDLDHIAYLLFTSGSTGKPKGVPISYKNLCHFINVNQGKYKIGPSDRLSQTFDHTFDLSIFDIFMALCHGAVLCVPQPIDLLSPTIFVNEKKLTVWFSVPSVINFARKKNILAKNSMPTLRLSLFCGEPLTLEAAQAWHDAAPNSRIENLYGPTELTIACSSYTYFPNDIVGSQNGIVSIGKIYDGLKFKILEANSQHELQTNLPGELCVAGPQNFSGYLNDREKTKLSQVIIDGEIYYRTGDIVKLSENNNLIYLGRKDQQIKVNGYRVELGEIESILRKIPRIIDSVVIGWPVIDNTYTGLVAFITGEEKNTEEITKALKKILPSYMVPTHIFWLEKMPLNANGKIDRNILINYLV